MSLSDNVRYQIINNFGRIYADSFGVPYGQIVTMAHAREGDDVESRVFNVIAFLVKDTFIRVEPSVSGGEPTFTIGKGPHSAAAGVDFAKYYDGVRKYVFQDFPSEPSSRTPLGIKRYQVQRKKAEELIADVSYPVSVYAFWLINRHINRDAIQSRVSSINRKISTMVKQLPELIGSGVTPKSTRRLMMDFRHARILSGRRDSLFKDEFTSVVTSRFPHIRIEEDGEHGWLFVDPGSAQFTDLWLEIFQFGEFLKYGEVQDNSSNTAILARTSAELNAILDQVPDDPKNQALRRRLQQAMKEATNRLN